ncbi:serine hydrolase domain-containing protein [Streptomyces tubercidicus]|uniref:serine hydrolase domain-containing protein n=1 Tax=Streptomyces tubercidicus TaxID=47759 RepID=UPI0036C5F765
MSLPRSLPRPRPGTGEQPSFSDTASSDDRPGVTVLVQRPDSLELRWHTGTAHLELSVPIGPDTTFNVGSVAKQITAHLVLLSARRGLIALDRPVAAYLPRFALPDVTLADLIRHQGGVRDAESLLSLAGLRDLDHYSAEDLLELAYRQTRRCTAAGNFLYSNTGYLLLADVLRSVHGTDLADLAAHWVFNPLAMTASRFMTDPRDVLPGAASSYAPTAAGWTRCQRPVTLPGPGSLWSSASDLARWLTYVHEEWTAPQPLVFAPELTYCTSDHERYVYGPGLYADTRRADNALVFHYGHEQGFSAATHLSYRGLRVVCLSNNAAVSADHVAADVLAALTGEAPGAPRGAEASVETLARLVSRRMDAATTMESTAAGTANSPPAATPETRLEHTELGRYVCDEVPGAVRLTRAGDTLYLWRRGTRDRLSPAGLATFSGTGVRLVLPDGIGPAPLPGTVADAPPTKVEEFTLHLNRAPDLHYRCVPADGE